LITCAEDCVGWERKYPNEIARLYLHLLADGVAPKRVQTTIRSVLAVLAPQLADVKLPSETFAHEVRQSD
jgi:hypothetical protein